MTPSPTRGASAGTTFERLPAVELAALIRRGEASPLEVVDAHIAALLRWNPYLNAVVAHRYEDARREARACAEVLARASVDELPPLLGVPFTVKECFGLEGMPHSSGSLLRRDVVCAESATVVDRLVRAGAIPLAVTNVPEMAMWTETDNLVYGRTHNPWDLSRTSGGSSGGEAAVVGAGASPFGIASDVGGSIRIPASFCGVFGHKPSGGLVPSTGHVPRPSPRAARFVGAGPIARSARDLGPLLQLMAGPDGNDVGCDPALTVADPRQVRMDALTVHVVALPRRLPVAPALRTAQARAAAALKTRGARVLETRFPELDEAFDLWGDSLKRANDISFEHWLGGGDPVQLLRQLVLAGLGRARHTVPALTFLALERLAQKVDFVRGGYEKAQQFKAHLEQRLGHDGVLLFPPFTTTAPKHGQTFFLPGAFVLSGVWNVLDVCSTQVPMGFDDAGLPTGVQVIGRPGNDATTIAVAMALEEDCGGWRPPPLPL